MDADLLELAAGDKTRAAHDKLHANFEYLEYVVPSVWFLLGCGALVAVFYGIEARNQVFSAAKWFQSVGEPSAGADIALGVVTVTVALNFIYVLAHLLNGVAEAIVDRILVRRLLQLPFEIYEHVSEARLITPARVRRIMAQRASYAVLCVSLIPVILCELTLVTWLQHSSAAVALRGRFVSVFVIAVIISCFHFGVPRLVTRAPADENTPAARMIGIMHLILLVTVATALTVLLRFGYGAIAIIALLPFANLVLAIVDRVSVPYSGGGTRPAFTWSGYFKATFVNWPAFAAALVDYGAPPSGAAIARAKRVVGGTDNATEFFWLAHLQLERLAPSLYSHVSRGQALAAMNRNLSNATTCTLAVSAFTFWSRWPDTFSIGPLVWVGALSLLAYMFLVRYLYLVSEQQSRILVLALASLEPLKRVQTDEFTDGSDA